MLMPLDKFSSEMSAHYEETGISSLNKFGSTVVHMILTGS